MNITIKAKLIAGFIFVSLIAVIIGYNAVTNLKSINADSAKLYEKVTIPLTQIACVETNFNKIRTKLRDAVFSSKETELARKHIETIKALEKNLNDNAGEFSKSILTPDGKKVYDNFMDALKVYMDAVYKVGDLALAGKGDEAYKMMNEPDVAAATKKADEALIATVELKKKVGKDVAAGNEILAEKSVTQMTALTIISLVLSVFLGFFIASGINKILHGLIGECRRLTGSILDGKLDVRANVDETNFEFRPITEGINEIMNAFVKPLNVTAEYIDRISKGDMPPRITDEYKGDFNEIKNNINQCIASIKALITDVNTVSNAAINGDFKFRADESKHNGDFRVVIKEVNNTVESFTGTLIRSIEHLEKLSNGVIEENITREYKGEFNRLKISFNKCFDAINLLIHDTDLLVKSATDGKLSDRADVTKHNGDYAKIIKGINDTLDAVITPIKECVSCLGELSKGNLDVEMAGDYKGDHAILKDALNATVNSISDTLNQVSIAADQVNTGSRQVAEGSQSLSQAATEQASSLEEISASLHQINAQTKQNADNSIQASQLSSQMRTTAEVGNDKMKQMLSAMTDINESATNISKIIKAIDEIAFQTNLLALNAAVEAARAGKHGKGFTVVAEEVRNLAQRSAKAAKETAEMIESSIKKTEAGTTIASETSGSLGEIVESVSKVNDIVSEIAAASKEQSQGIAQINVGITQIDRATQQNTATAEESAAASEELSGQAVELKEMLSRFRLKNYSLSQSAENVVKAYMKNNTGKAAKQAVKPAIEKLNYRQDAKKLIVNAAAAGSENAISPEDVIDLDDRQFGKF